MSIITIALAHRNRLAYITWCYKRNVDEYVDYYKNNHQGYDVCIISHQLADFLGQKFGSIPVAGHSPRNIKELQSLLSTDSEYKRFDNERRPGQKDVLFLFYDQLT